MIKPPGTNMKNRFLLIVLADLLAFLLLLGLIWDTPVPGLGSLFNSRRPNVIFIVLDAARADHFSGYGYAKETTPEIDRIGSAGAVFLNNFSQGTHTLASIPRILTSRYFSINLFQHDLMRWGSRWELPGTIFNRLDAQQVILPKVMADNGYQVVAFHNHGCCLPKTELGKNFDKDYYCFVSPTSPKDERLISQMMDWLENTRDSDKPFFIYYHIMSPHEPYPEKPEDYQILKGDSRADIDAVRKKFHQRQKDTPEGWSEKELRILNGLYDGNLRHSDRWIGILDRKLDELGLSEDTLMIVTADHGERLGEHGSLGHAGPPWDSLTHIPLIMRYPPLIPPKTRISGFTESVDIVPTIFEICNIHLPSNKSLDGMSLLSIIDDPERARQVALTDTSLRTEKHKYVAWRNVEFLYDLENDPHEENNIAARNPEFTMKIGEAYQKAIAPYRNRYKRAQVHSAPDFPFYYSSGLDVGPKESIETIEDIRKDTREIARNLSGEKAWVLNDHAVRWKLFCLPDNGPPSPLTFSAKAPNGEYVISLLVETPFSSPSSPSEFGLQYRFDPETPFLPASGMKNVCKNYDYIELGKVKVTNLRFAVEVKLEPRDGSRFIIHHVKFTPSVTGQETPEQTPPGEEVLKRQASLKALGYL